MKVLLLLEATLGGTARHVLDLAVGLLRRGYEVHFLYSTHRADKMFLDDLDRLRQQEPDLRCREIAIDRELSWRDLTAFLRLSRYIQRNGPFQILHSHSTKAGFLLRLVPLRGTAASLYTPHALMTLDPDIRRWRRSLVRIMEAGLSGLCDSMIAVSAQEREHAIRLGIPAQKISVIANGLDPSTTASPRNRDAIRSGLGIGPDEVCIGFIGRLAAQKSPQRALEAFDLLRAKTAVPVKLIVAGWGPFENDLRDQVASTGLSGAVRFLGQVRGTDYLPAFDVLAHTSRYEGFPYIFLEALAAGLPVVTTRVGAAEEIFTDPAFGMICDPWDATNFAQQLQRFVADPTLRAAAAPLARARAAQFDVDSMVNATVALYERILKAPAYRSIPDPASHRF